MRIAIDIPPDIEQLLLEKCEKAGITPSEFVLSLLDWYFLKKYGKISTDSNLSKNLSEFLKVANQCAAERIKYCKYSDGRYCAREVFEDILEEKEPERIVPYKCLFCPYFTDKRKKETKKIERDLADKTYDIAKIAATLLFKMYGDKLGYRPKVFCNVEEEHEDTPPEKESSPEKEVKKLLDW